VGDFDPKQLDTWVDKYFASIPKPNMPLLRVQVKEEARSVKSDSSNMARTFRCRRSGITLPVPSQKSEDSAALTS
jgi:zinc protease